MNKEKLEAQIIDYIDGQLNDSDRKVLEKILSEDKEAQELYQQLSEVLRAIDRSADLEPGERLKTGFDKILEAESRHLQSPKTRILMFQPVVYRIAAAVALVASGIFAGLWINKNQEQEKQIADLQEEVTQTKQIMLAMLENQQSASQRMIGTTVAMTLNKPDDEIIRVLVKTMNEDPNTNVRLAALDALLKFQEESSVRKALIGSLATQNDPAVQITLIQFLVKMREKEIVNQLHKIADDEATIKAVRDEAYSGIMKLS
ncbi:MAG TPA: HEAT repeat domain-containing protein [Cyclobacteriaceae bacterium]|nr:HEAT repeat domain-containing protein [Cyclobacteriaceae bacterium]